MITSLPTQIGIVVATTSVVYKLFDVFDSNLGSDAKVNLWLWLSDKAPSRRLLNSAQDWIDISGFLVDRVFGYRLLSWQGFVRSCALSLVSLCICFVCFVPKNIEFPRLLVSYGLPIVLFSNLIPDYICVLETRVAMKLMSATKSIVLRFSIICADIFFTALTSGIAVSISLGPIARLRTMQSFGLNHDLPSILLKLVRKNCVFFISHPFEAIWNGAHFSHSADRFNTGNVFFYPAFLTSIWLWLYFVSGILLRFAQRFDLGFSLFNKTFDIEQKPLRSMGIVAAAIVMAMLSLIYLTFDVAQ